MAQRLTPAQIAAMARARDLDPQAVLAVARQEGLGGGIGDSGHAFGPFQLNNAGGIYPSGAPQEPQAANEWAWSPQGVNYALGGIQRVAGGLQGPEAVRAIVSRFERPADPSGEIARALGQPVTAALAGPQVPANPQVQGPLTASRAAPQPRQLPAAVQAALQILRS